MPKNPYSGFAMDHTKTRAALEQAGVEGLTEETLNGGKLIQYRGTFEAKPFLVKIFVNGKGKCTIGASTGFDQATFDVLAEAIANHCKFGDSARLELSVANFNKAHQPLFVEFLTQQGATLDSEVNAANHRILRFTGPRGDTLTIKFYTNGTLQLQGSHAQLAVWSLDFIETVFPLEALLDHQKAAYKLPVTLQQIKDDLTARVPNVHDWLEDTVRINFSSAFAMTKVDIELEDFSVVAFPALKGLEGFSFQVMRDECKFSLPQKVQLGDYFERQGTSFVMRSPHGDGVAADVQALLAQCYNMWHSQRHRLFHMDGTVETSKILGSRTQAVSIVDEVLTAVDQGYATLVKTKGKK